MLNRIGSAFEVFSQTGGFSGGVNYPGAAPKNPFKLDRGTKFGLWLDYTKGSETSILLQFEVERDPGSGVFWPLYVGDTFNSSYSSSTLKRWAVTGTGKYAIPFTMSNVPGPSVFGERLRIGVATVAASNGTTAVSVYLSPVEE